MFHGVIKKTSLPQSNLRRARRFSADKTSSKLLGLHSPSMLSPFKTSRAESDSAGLGDSAYASICRCMVCRCKMSPGHSYSLHGPIAMLRLFCYVFAREFLFNLQFDLEPDYIVRKGIRQRIQRCNLHREILSTFHT